MTNIRPTVKKISSIGVLVQCLGRFLVVLKKGNTNPINLRFGWISKQKNIYFPSEAPRPQAQVTHPQASLPGPASPGETLAPHSYLSPHPGRSPSLPPSGQITKLHGASRVATSELLPRVGEVKEASGPCQKRQQDRIPHAGKLFFGKFTIYHHVVTQCGALG